MKTDWDYTTLAESYLKRPPYSPRAIELLLTTAGMQPGMRTCDIGAGCAALTLPFLKKGLNVVAVEPNPAMRAMGLQQTRDHSRVSWLDSCGEATGLASNAFDLVSFGSSFNVVDQAKALHETARILKPRGWFVCLWNHRNLNDPTQCTIEQIIKTHIPDYDYGSRRRDQAGVIRDCRRFCGVQKFENTFEYRVNSADYMEAWSSHATLRRQAGNKLEEILTNIRDYLSHIQDQALLIPYTTRMWMAQKR